MTLLILSLVALLVGPLTFHFLRPNSVLMHTLDGFVLVAVSGLVLFHLLPHSVALGGVWAAAAAAVGLLAPLILGHHDEGVSHRIGLWAIPALLGLSVHAFIDGAALITHAHGQNHQGEVLPLAVVLHRIPVGLAIWWMVRPAVGSARALGLVALIAGMTTAGFLVSAASAQEVDLGGLAIFQALVGGLLLHIIFHHQTSAEPRERSRLGEGIGALLALAMLFTLHEEPLATHGESLEAGTMFLLLARHSAPALLAGILGAALLRALLGEDLGRRVGGPERWGAILKGAVLGLCGISARTFPTLQSLLDQGAAPSGAFSAFFSARLLGLPAILLTLPLLGTQVTLLRLLLSGLLAMAVSLALSFILPVAAARPAPSPAALPAGKNTAHEMSGDADQAPHGEPPPPPPRGLGRLKQEFTHQFRAAFLPILSGLVLASVVEPMVRGGVLAGLGPGLEVGLLALIGAPGYINSITATMLATLLVRKGASWGGAMAFMITGPSLSVTTLRGVTHLWGRRAAGCLAGLTLSASVGAGLWLNQISPPDAAGSLPGGSEGVNALITWGSLALLGGLSLATLLQSGVRRLLTEINH